MIRPLRFAALFGVLLFAAGARALAAGVPLHFDRIDLLDGRVLKDVTVKSYDAASGKLLVVADGDAMLVPLNQIPAPFAEHLKKDAPPAGSTTAVVATRVAIPMPQPLRPLPRAEPPHDDARRAAAELQQLLARHKKAAEARALRYYRYEFPAGSSAITVTAVDLEADQPEPVDGWPGRYRTKGKAHLEFYDSNGRSFSRSSGAFEVITEQKPGEPLKVVDFTPK